MLRSIPTILTVALAGACLSAQDDQAGETRRYDVRTLAAAMTETQLKFSFTSPLVWPAIVRERPPCTMGEPEPDAGTSRVADLIRFVLAAQDGTPSRAQVKPDDGWLRVIGSREAQDLVPRVLGELTRTIFRDLEVELSILPPGSLEAVSSAVLDAPKAERLITAANPVATLRTHVRPWVETRIEAITRRAYAKRYDVKEPGGEVAETRNYDPEIDAIASGTRALIRVDPMPDGGLVVTVRGQQANVDEPIRTLPTRGKADLVLQLPGAAWAATSASARIESGGALVIGTEVVPKAVWVIRVVATPRAEATSDSPVRLVPVQGAVVRLRTLNPTFPAPTGSVESAEPATPQEDPALGPVYRISPDAFLERVRAIHPEPPSHDDVLSTEHIWPFVVICGTKDLAARAVEEISKVAEEATSRFDYEIRLGTVPSEGWTPPAAKDLETFAETLDKRATTTGIVGDRVVLLAGRTESYVKDYDIELGGQTATIIEPIVGQLFTGFSMSCAGGRTSTGHCLLDARLEYQERISMKTFCTSLQPDADITFDVPEIAAVTARISANVALGAWTLLHTAPLVGTGRQLVVMVRVRGT